MDCDDIDMGYAAIGEAVRRCKPEHLKKALAFNDAADAEADLVQRLLQQLAKSYSSDAMQCIKVLCGAFPEHLDMETIKELVHSTGHTKASKVYQKLFYRQSKHRLHE
jgi:hypothetical protein